jgi:hypothetical protein
MEDATREQTGKQPQSAPEASNKTFYGVKSYVHKFYENKRPDFDESIYENDENLANLTAPPKYPCAYSTKWHNVLVCGILTLVIGAIILVIVHAIPIHKAIVGYRRGEPLIDQKAAFLKEEIEIGTAIGLSCVLFGGLLIASSVLIPSLFTEEDEYPPDHTIKVSINGHGYSKLPNKEDTAVPSASRVSNVQPQSTSQSSTK